MRLITEVRYHEICREMAEIPGMDGDEENWHIAADDLLVKLLDEMGMGELSEAYDSIHKWYA